jgi:predicted HTH domain antitoxin
MSVNFSFEWTLPQKVFGNDFQEEDFRNHVRQMVAISLFKEGRISSGLAAELLNISRREFFELLHRKSIPYFDLDENEIE